MTKIIISNPGGAEGAPSTARVLSYCQFFAKHNFSVVNQRNYSICPSLEIIFRCILSGSKTVLITMPPFRGWLISILPFVRVIIDIRDGWSIAMKSGYGGSSKKKPLKAKIAAWIEKMAIRRSFITITCTTGLQDYLQKISEHSVLLVPNGMLDADLEMINKIKAADDIEKSKNELIFICAGKFSEYGANKAKKLLQVIYERYKGDKKLVVRLVGSDIESNRWAVDYFRHLTNEGGRVELLPRMNKYELFTQMVAADFGLSIVRDPDYEFGTKVFDYIAAGLPIINYFDESNKFTDYFDGCLDRPFINGKARPEIRRSILIENSLSRINWHGNN